MHTQAQSSASTRGRGALTIAALAALLSLPAWLPGAEAYIDNAPHLVELQALATEILPRDHWTTGWTDAAEHGFAVGEYNGPLAWVPAALAVAAGASPAMVWALGATLSNIAFGLGALTLGRRLWGQESAARAGAVLALAAVSGLYGIGGCMGGMWPWRLGLGLLAFGVGAPSERFAWRNALWLSAATLLHPFAGALAFAWAGLNAVRGLLSDSRPLALSWVAGALTALAGTAFFWTPLMNPQVRDFGRQLLLDPLWVIAYALLPLEPFLRAPTLLLESGGWGIPTGLAVLVGLAVVLRRRLWPRTPLAAMLAGSAVGIVALVSLVGLTDSPRLGPNPWRYVAATQLILACFAGGGIAAIGGQRIAGAFAVLAALAAGAHELPLRYGPAAATWADLEATWADVAAAQPQGWVLHEDPMFDETAPALLQRCHVGALLPERTGLPTVGSWYGINTIATAFWTTTEGEHTLATWEGGVSRWPDALYERLVEFNIGAVVTVGTELPAMFAHDPRYVQVSAHGPFTAWRLAAAPTPLARGHSALTLTAPGDFELPRTWHPGWSATLDGQPVPLVSAPSTGFIQGSAPKAGVVRFEWRPATRFAAIPAALALLALVLLRWLPAAPEPGPLRWTPGRVVAAAALAHFVAWTALLEEGVLTIDEIGYQLATRAIVRGDGLWIDVGAGTLPLGSLQALVPGFSAQITEHGGRLVCQYPPLSAVLASPLFALFGEVGVNLLNGIALVACAWLTAWLARRWDASPTLALVVLLFGSFFWEYSLAGLPHLTAIALVLGAIALAERGDSPLFCGLLVGAALAVRLDVVLLFPVIGLQLVRRGGVKATLQVAAGAAPLVLALSAANAWRFGTWNPLSYGVSVTDPTVGDVANTAGAGLHLPLAGLGIATLACWMLADWLSGWRRKAALGLTGLFGLGLVALLAPGFAEMVVDMRTHRGRPLQPAMVLLPDGSTVYLRQAKKALLQSCPWLVLLALALPRMIRRGPRALLDRPGWAGILGGVLFFCAPAWDGGLSLNMRYLLQVLPLAAIELAFVVRHEPAFAARRALLPGALLGLGLAAFAANQPDLGPGSVRSIVLICADLVIALVCLGTLTALRRPGALLPFCLALALGWSGGVAFGIDLGHHQGHRAAHRRVGEQVSRFVPSGAVVVAPIPDPIATLYKRGDVVVGNLIADGGAAFPALVDAARAEGRPIFVLAEDSGGPSKYPIHPPARFIAYAPPFRLLELDRSSE